MIHVLMLSTWYPQHPEDISGCFFREQALALKKLGVKIGAIGAYQRPLSRPIEAIFGSSHNEFEDDQGIPTFRRSSINFPPRWSRGIYWRTEALVRQLFERYVDRCGVPDIVHVQSSFYAGSAAMMLHRQYKIPYIVQEHCSIWNRGGMARWERNLQAKIYDCAAMRLSVSNNLAIRLAKVLGRGKNYACVVPNSVGEDFLESELLPSSSENFQFIHVSTLDKNKNVDGLLRAFAMRFKGLAGYRLVIGGDGPERRKLVAAARVLGVGDQVRFTGRLTRRQVISEMQRSDAFVLSSKTETFGVVIIEALAMGLPVVSTRCGGPEDILDETTGVLVDLDNSAQLADGMFQVASDRGRWRKTSLRRICRQRYAPEHIAARWLRLYGKALTASSSGNTDQ